MNGAGAALIFLDFDGVLRRKSAPLYVLEKGCVRTFEEAVRALPGAEIVITSSWREGFTLAELKRGFSPDIAARIRGITPISQNRDGHYRHREVLAYLKRNELESRPWIAIDDDTLHYPGGVSLVLVDSGTGFDAAAAERFLAATKSR